MKKLLATSWILVLIGLFFLQSQFKSESTFFLGITHDTGQAISFEYPVVIVDISVTDGQKVDQGKTLLKVRRRNLDSKQAILSEKIIELDFRNKSSKATLLAEVKSLQARKAAEQADLDVQIQKLKAQYRTNQKLLSDITGSKNIINTRDNPLFEQIAALKKQRRHVGRSLQAQIDSLRSQLKSNKRPIYAQMNELKQRRSELNRQVTELVVDADFAGQVGKVMYKAGETVDAFNSILTLHPMYPELIKGYINENVYNKVRAGDDVWVTSVALNGAATPYKGIVENVGNRIVEYPQRLKKSMMVPAWGREVLIRVEVGNDFLLGEKVNVGLQPPKPSLSKKVLAYLIDMISSYAGEAAYANND